MLVTLLDWLELTRQANTMGCLRPQNVFCIRCRGTNNNSKCHYATLGFVAAAAELAGYLLSWTCPCFDQAALHLLPLQIIDFFLSNQTPNPGHSTSCKHTNSSKHSQVSLVPLLCPACLPILPILLASFLCKDRPASEDSGLRCISRVVGVSVLECPSPPIFSLYSTLLPRPKLPTDLHSPTICQPSLTKTQAQSISSLITHNRPVLSILIIPAISIIRDQTGLETQCGPSALVSFACSPRTPHPHLPSCISITDLISV